MEVQIFPSGVKILRCAIYKYIVTWAYSIHNATVVGRDITHDHRLQNVKVMNIF